jgi:hypothetical protein
VVVGLTAARTDVLGRIFADYVVRELKQAVFVESKGGAGRVFPGRLDPCAQSADRAAAGKSRPT